jgi:hypothetical protein
MRTLSPGKAPRVSAHHIRGDSATQVSLTLPFPSTSRDADDWEENNELRVKHPEPLLFPLLFVFLSVQDGMQECSPWPHNLLLVVNI